MNNKSIPNKSADSTVFLTAKQIANGIKSKQFSVTEVVEDHINRIEEVNGALNAVIWPLFDEAREQARQYDKDLAQSEPDKFGPLFGVPITIKDQFYVRGTPVSCGLSHAAKKKYDHEGSLVSRLRAKGAIPIGKTSLPQLLISHECHHSHYGRAKNPWDTKRTPGGSSGGEASIIAAGGSPLGLGGDMGGSIRIPSHFCGTCGLKPTGNRLPNDDSPLIDGPMSELLGFEGIVVQPGPMARSVEDLELAMNCLLNPALPNPFPAPAATWSPYPETEIKKLRIGFYDDDEVFTVSPAIRRVVNEAADFLKDQGIEVVPFRVPDAAKATNLYLSLACSDGGAWIDRALAGEAPVTDVAYLKRAGILPNTARKVMIPVLKALGQHQAARLLRSTGAVSTAEYWMLTAARTKYRVKFAQAMERAKVDVFLCPPHCVPAPFHESNKNGAQAATASYPAIFNLIGLPAGVIQAGRVGKNEESDRGASRDRVIQDVLKTEKGSAGLPVGVQIVGRHWREDQVLAVMKLLESHFRENPDYPRRPPV